MLQILSTKTYYLQFLANPTDKYACQSPLFQQPLTKGSWAGLVTLTAYMAAKIGIMEYCMDKYLKIHYQLEDKLFRWKVMPNKSALIDWTYRTCWNSGDEPRKVMAGEAPPLSSQPTPQEWTVYLHWFCPVKHTPNPRTSSTRPEVSQSFLSRRDDRIRRISQASNVKEPTRFMVTSWIVGIDEGHDNAIWSVFLFCYRTFHCLPNPIVCQNRVCITLFKW